MSVWSQVPRACVPHVVHPRLPIPRGIALVFAQPSFDRHWLYLPVRSPPPSGEYVAAKMSLIGAHWQDFHLCLPLYKGIHWLQYINRSDQILLRSAPLSSPATRQNSTNRHGGFRLLALTSANQCRVSRRSVCSDQTCADKVGRPHPCSGGDGWSRIVPEGFRGTRSTRM